MHVGLLHGVHLQARCGSHAFSAFAGGGWLPGRPPAAAGLLPQAGTAQQQHNNAPQRLLAGTAAAAATHDSTAACPGASQGHLRQQPGVERAALLPGAGLLRVVRVQRMDARHLQRRAANGNASLPDLSVTTKLRWLAQPAARGSVSKLRFCFCQHHRDAFRAHSIPCPHPFRLVRLPGDRRDGLGRSAAGVAEARRAGCDVWTPHEQFRIYQEAQSAWYLTLILNQARAWRRSCRGEGVRQL